MRQSGFQYWIKRAFDWLAACIGIILVSPLLLAGMIAVRISMGRPVFFRQLRPGRRGRPFTVSKFRTMNAKRGADGELLPDDERLTKTGKFLRSTSLDELPQLINVLRGDMSLVGPRPLRMEYLDRYSPRQSMRHDVMPGITGWAQINGRNTLTWEEKFELDLWYVDNWSLWLDVRILALTFLSVLKREGISSKDHATMPEFKGYS